MARPCGIWATFYTKSEGRVNDQWTTETPAGTRAGLQGRGCAMLNFKIQPKGKQEYA
jgi:hypothetical protein